MPVVVGLLGVGSTDLVSRVGLVGHNSFRVQRLLRGRIHEVEDVVEVLAVPCVVVSILAVPCVVVSTVVEDVVEGVVVP